MMEAGEPHEAIFYALAYLPLSGLLRMREVCRSLRDVVNDDASLWVDLFVDWPLSLRLTDAILLKITSKAQGRLRTLALFECVSITEKGLQLVTENNPHINKLFIPRCNGLTPDGVVSVVKRMTDHNQDLKFLKMRGLCSINKENLEAIHTCLQISPLQLQQQQPMTFLDHIRSSELRNKEPIRPVDVEICPKCKDVDLVFDCPRESCSSKRQHPLTVCRGCYHCIPRCEECGGCVNFGEMEESLCMDVLCSECWLQLPKCNMCNKPNCNRHAGQWVIPCSSGGFVCRTCKEEEAFDLGVFTYLN